MIDFTNIAYLKTGNPIQVQAYHTLTQNSIIEVLYEFAPILVGTIPININIENSDLDIICYWQNKSVFIKKLKLLFENKKDFEIREIEINGYESVIANFKTDHFEIEIFGQNIPTKKQNGYKHMIIKHEILQSKGENFRLDIIRLKQKGYKTEPSFSYLLDLKGEPYAELLEYKL